MSKKTVAPELRQWAQMAAAHGQPETLAQFRALLSVVSAAGRVIANLKYPDSNEWVQGEASGQDKALDRALERLRKASAKGRP